MSGEREEVLEFVRPQRALNKSIANFEHFLTHERASSNSVTLVGHDGKRVMANSATEVPIGESFLFDDGVVVDRVNEDTFLVANDEEERIVRLASSRSNLNTSTLGTSLGTTPHDDYDDSPLFEKMSANAATLLGGEEVTLCLSVPVLASLFSGRQLFGYLMLTNYRILFVPDAELPAGSRGGGAMTKEVLLRFLPQAAIKSFASFPLGFVRSVQSQSMVPFSSQDDGSNGQGRRGGVNSTTPDVFNVRVSNSMIQVRLVDGRTVTYEVTHTHLKKNAAAVATLLEQLNRSYFANPERCFALSFKPDHPYTFDGWSVYNFFREMRRQFQPIAAILVLDEEAPDGAIIGSKAGQIRPTEWRVFNVSNLCSTYPTNICVPRALSDAQLETIAAHRTRGRIPALAFLHPVTGAALVRCSQPMSGIKQIRCEDDEFYFREMARRNPSGKGLVIYDARPFLNAAWNRGIKGAGYENEEYYNCKVHFLDVPNIYRVQSAHEELLASLHGNATTEIASVEEQKLDALVGGASAPSSGNESWLQQLSKLLAGALKIARNLHEGFCVAVHCSDGWDRTPLLTSLAMLLCDPFYRTLMGFQILIEWQWVSFGHKFASRNGFCGDNDDFSPIFLQWLDCCWQLLRQKPGEFEFSEKFLFTIAQELYCHKFGTFLAETVAERTEKWQNRTQSLWSQVNSRAAQQEYMSRAPFQHDYANAPIWAQKDTARSDNKPNGKKATPEADWKTDSSDLAVCRSLHLFS